MAKRQTRIIVETTEVIVRHNVAATVVAWCPECRAETRQLTVMQVAQLCGTDQTTIRERICSGQLHASEMPGCGLLICLASLSHP